MAKNITDNFAQEVKPWQLRHFFNLHICNLDNIDSFYQYYYENILMQQPADFLYHNLGVYSLMSIEQKHNWIQKWTKTAEHRTFAECFVAAFMAASLLIFNTVSSCATVAFKNNDVLHGLVEGIRLAERHSEVLEDFCNFVQNDLLIRTASPLMIREIICDATEYEFNYTVAITPEENSFLYHFLLFKHIKENTDKTLCILGQSPISMFQPCKPIHY
jgi:ribonucleotide reductase beta subunit family protein with ferritin-like domain